MMSASRVETALSSLKSISGNRIGLVTGLAAAICAAGVSSTVVGSSAKNESSKDSSTKLDVYFMDRIAKKPYLNSLVHKPHETRYSNRASEHQTALETPRPKGVPTRLRILTIDVPAIKTDAFRDGICRQPSQIFGGVTDPVFKDGVARSKQVDLTSQYETQTRKERREYRRPIEQKSLAKMLYYCYGKSNAKSKDSDLDPVIGVEILEASILNLNPNNIRRTYTSKSAYKYDPGKYSDSKLEAGDGDERERLKRHETDSGIADVEETTEEVQQGDESADVSNNIKARDEKEDTRTAPWNQYAWLEEIHLRIHGLVPFNAPMKRSSILSHNIFGRAYQQNVPSSTSFLRWLFPWPLWGSSRVSLEGIDGEGECLLYDNSMVSKFKGASSKSKRLNRASNKPHAVVADGTAMQRVPGSLRFLTKVCRDAGVPLYVLNDPRSWGRLASSSYSTLDEALVDLRRTVTDNVVSNALELREGNAFERGRFVGRWEKEMEWQARDAARKTRQTWLDAKQRWREQTQIEDWSQLNMDELRAKLIDKKMLTDHQCSDALKNICRACMKPKPDTPSEHNA